MDTSVTHCNDHDLAAYVDGELDDLCLKRADEHLVSCAECRSSLNTQKQLLSMLTGGLQRENDIELPKDFARQVVVKAESHVTGLRRPIERFNTAFIVAAFVFFALFAVGSESSVFAGISRVFEQVSAVVGFFGQMIYSFLVGLVVLVRSFSSVAPAGLGAVIVFLGVFVALSLTVSFKFFRPRRA